jgi:hypothetical protein
MGSTKRFQPYCRLAIITMQMMPKMSCHHRDVVDATVCSGADAATVIGVFSPVASVSWRQRAIACGPMALHI